MCRRLGLVVQQAWCPAFRGEVNATCAGDSVEYAVAVKKSYELIGGLEHIRQTFRLPRTEEALRLSPITEGMGFICQSRDPGWLPPVPTWPYCTRVVSADQSRVLTEFPRSVGFSPFPFFSSTNRASAATTRRPPPTPSQIPAAALEQLFLTRPVLMAVVWRSPAAAPPPPWSPVAPICPAGVRAFSPIPASLGRL